MQNEAQTSDGGKCVLMLCSFPWSLSYFEFFMLNNLFLLEKALALADNSAQHLLVSGESSWLFLGKCRFLIGICDPAQEHSEWSCGWGCDHCLVHSSFEKEQLLFSLFLELRELSQNVEMT